MKPNRKKKESSHFYFYAILTLLFVSLFLVIKNISLSQTNKELTNKYALSKYDKDYWSQVRRNLNFPTTDIESLNFRDAIKTLGKLNIQLNRYANFDKDYLKKIKRRYPHKRPLTIKDDVAHVTLNSRRNYQLVIENKSDQNSIGPIPFQDVLWFDVHTLVDSLGLLDIKNEVQRAKKVWDFLAENIHQTSPPTEGKEEHDLMKYLINFGYGMCDDSSVAFTQLGSHANLETRFWGIAGHVTPEVRLNGKWAMLDSNMGYYAYNPKNQNEIYGVEELANNPELFKNVKLHKTSRFIENKNNVFNRIKNMVISMEDNFSYGPENGVADHTFKYTLRPGEKIVFRNSNYGKFWLGRYTDKLMEYYNGYFEYTLENQLIPVEQGFVSIPIESPFPLVGGEITGLINTNGVDGTLTLKDSTNDIVEIYPLDEKIDINTDSFFHILGPSPTYNYVINFQFESPTTLEIKRLKVYSDFQYSQLALIDLKPGKNSFNIYYPDANAKDNFAFALFSQK